MSRRLIFALIGILFCGAIAGGYLLFLRPRAPRPQEIARQLFEKQLPSWQIARVRQAKAGAPGPANGPAQGQGALHAALWPQVDAALGQLDAVWPDEAAVREAAATLNRALRQSGLRYYVDSQHIQSHPMLLSYELVSQVPWRAGEHQVDVLRLRRLDHLNIEMGMFGETEGTQPLVLLDRLEASMVDDLGRAFAPKAKDNKDEIDRVALFHLRRLLETSIGPRLAPAADKLRRREELVESMRQRFHNGKVQLAQPESFVFGEAWFESMTPYTDMKRFGGPLILDTDLRSAARADEELREPESFAALQAVIDFMAQATEAHEAHHALAQLDTRVLPPPAPLLELMEGSSGRFQVLAEHELRAYLGELADSTSPACLTLTKLTRSAFGRTARATPHFYAARLILTRLANEQPTTPAALLDRLCAMSDGELRKQVAAAYVWLYGSAAIPAQRGTPS